MSWRFSLLNRFEDPPGGITEGPAWNGEVLLFTHIHASRIYAYNPKVRRVLGVPPKTPTAPTVWPSTPRAACSAAVRTAAPSSASTQTAAW